MCKIQLLLNNTCLFSCFAETGVGRNTTPQPEKEALIEKVLVKEEEELVKVEEGKKEEGQWEEGTHMVLQPVVPTKQCSQIALYLRVIVQDLCLLLEF